MFGLSFLSLGFHLGYHSGNIKMMERVGQTEKKKNGGRRVGSSMSELLNDQEKPETAHINVTYVLRGEKFRENWRTFTVLTDC